MTLNFLAALARKLEEMAALPPGRPPEVPELFWKAASDPSWKGPVYWRARKWRRDVLLVTGTLRSLLACNAPLVPGLAVAARHEYRIRTGRAWFYRWVRFRYLVPAGLLLSMAAALIVPEHRLATAALVLFLFAQIAFLIWLVGTVFRVRNDGRALVYLALERRLSAGHSLSEAMASLPRFFPRYLVDLVAAGEVTGTPVRALDQFNVAMLATLQLQRRLRTSLNYVKVAMVFQVLIAYFVVRTVFPVLVEIIEKNSEGEPVADWAGLTHHWFVPDLLSMMSAVDGLSGWAPLLFWIIVPLIVWYVVHRFRHRRGWATGAMSSFYLRLPWFRGLVVRTNLSLIAHMLHGLLRAGIPMDQALASVLCGDLLPAYREWLSAFRERMLQGDSLQEAFARTVDPRLVPPSFTGLLAAGERVGQLPETLERIASLYRREVERRLHTLAALALPAGVLLMGYLVLSIEATVFGTLVQLADILLG